MLRGVGGGVNKATALSNGVALPPFEAPEAVHQIIEAGNSIARTPYKWGGGHGKWQDTGYDCSGSVSFALAAAGLLEGPLASGPLMSWGERGPGQVGHDLRQPGARVPRGRRHPLRHLRREGHGIALAERPAHQRGLRGAASHRASEPLGVSTPSASGQVVPMKDCSVILLNDRLPDAPLPRFTPDLPTGPPPEVLEEIDAAWERAQALVGFELHFETDPEWPHKAYGELRRSDGTLECRLTAARRSRIACGDPVATRTSLPV